MGNIVLGEELIKFYFEIVICVGDDRWWFKFEGFGGNDKLVYVIY